MSYKVGYLIGSLSSTSLNRLLAKALIKLAPADLEFHEIEIKDLPLYTPEYDVDYPPEGRALKQAIADSDAILFLTPEYNRSIPGALKNAIDWASRPWGQNSLVNKPTAVIGTSPGIIATAIGQQHLKAILGFCNTRQLTTPEAYVQFTPGLIDEDGNVTDDDMRGFFTMFMKEFDEHTRRVLTVLPPQR